MGMPWHVMLGLSDSVGSCTQLFPLQPVANLATLWPCSYAVNGSHQMEEITPENPTFEDLKQCIMEGLGKIFPSTVSFTKLSGTGVQSLQLEDLR